MKFDRNLGMLLLAIWLIAMGLFPLLGLRFNHQQTLMNVLALAAGVLLVLRR